jgi:putative transposase
MSEDDGLEAMGQAIQIDEARIRNRFGEMVRGAVEELLNALLDAEADRLCGAGRYERAQGRQDIRAGSYKRSLHAVAGEVNLQVPKPRRQTFETAIIERYRRRESSVEEALINGIVIKRNWAGEVCNFSLLLASALSSEGFRAIVRICEGVEDGKSGWPTFLSGRPRPERRAVGHFRRVQGPCRERGGFPAGGALPALHSVLLPQRL